MGVSKVCKYRVEETYGFNRVATVYGTNALPKDLERHVMAGVVSTMPGYINENVGAQFGIRVPSRVRYIAQRGSRAGTVVREWVAPAFLTLPNPEDYPEVAKAVRLTRAA